MKRSKPTKYTTAPKMTRERGPITIGGTEAKSTSAKSTNAEDAAMLTIEPTEFKRGIPTLFDDSMVARMFMLAQLGLTMENLAIAFNINLSTLRHWMDSYPELYDACIKGKEIFDYSVERSLMERAKGYNWTEVKTVEGTDFLGRESTMVTTTNKHVPADSTAQFFWLKNRHPLRWHDVHRSEINSNIDINVKNTLQLNNLTVEEREMVQGIAMKQIAEMNGVTKSDDK